jgi:hypothetical protein
MGGRFRRLTASLIAVVFAASCTSPNEDPPPDSLPSAAESADELMAAYSDGDFEATAAALDNSGTDVWTARRLRRWTRRHVEAGLVTAVELERAGEPKETPGVGESVDVPYTVTIESTAMAEPAVLSGTLGLSFDSDSERWVAEWDESALWPGIEGGSRFDVVTKWPRRAPLLDRRGRPIAVGRAESRRYPFGSLAGSTIGHLEPLVKQDMDEDDALHRAGDLVGGSGLEEAFEDELAGTPGSRLVVVDTAGRKLETLGRRAAVPGRPARTTLDMQVQRAAQEAYGSGVGGAVALDPSTGDLLAVVDSGAFDPGSYVGVGGIEPFNRALVGLYPPGSAMKVVTASAALDTGTVRPTTNVTGPKEYKGVRNFESGEFGTIDFATALKFSVNTAFAQVAEDLGGRALTRYATAFGFNRQPALPVEAAESSFPPPQDLSDVMWGSIGQAQVLATPMQMASVAATVANGGRRMEPRIAMGERPTGERAIKRRTARTMTALMENVVVGGTGSAARIGGVRVAGKTGTAEVDVAGERKNHAWFVCFAPADDPKVAIAVVSEYGGVGGEVAAPIAGRMLIRVLPLVR